MQHELTPPGTTETVGGVQPREADLPLHPLCKETQGQHAGVRDTEQIHPPGLRLHPRRGLPD